MLWGLIACSARHEQLSAEFLVMGGIPVHVTAWEVEPRRFRRAVSECRQCIQGIESSMSVYRSNSLISRVNRGEIVALDDHTAAVVDTALEVAHRTGCAFDPTVGPLVELWKTAARERRLPEPGELAAARDLVGLERVALARGRPPRLSVSRGTRLDLGGVAKGYAADAGVEVLAAHGITRALVELGGDVSVLDIADLPRPFTIGIRHPTDRARLLGRLRVASGGVVTSGSTERYFEIGGVRYCHVVDPRSGQPVDGVLSATVTAPTSAEADAVATALMVLGWEAGLEMVSADPDLEAVIVVADPTRPEGFRVELSSGAARSWSGGGSGSRHRW
jgi:thiamine biosynthesis lipoprotein